MAGLNCLPRFRNPFSRKKKVSQKGEDRQKTGREEPVLHTAVRKLSVEKVPRRELIKSQQRTPLTPPRIQSNDDNDEPLLAPTISIRTATEPVQSDTNDTQQVSRSPSTATLNTPARHSRRSSEADPRIRSSSNASSTDGHRLKKQLDAERIECPHRPHCFFVPNCRQEALITKETVAEDIIDRNPEIGLTNATLYADTTCRCARKLYGILAYIKKGDQICSMLDEGLTDEDLPLERKPNAKSRFTLVRQNGQPIKTMDGWKDKHLENFDRIQPWMNAPVFKSLEHLELDKKTVLPFMPLDEHTSSLTKKQGGYSEVYPVRIHPAHHEFWNRSASINDEPLIAVKALFSDIEEEFKKEVDILQALGPKDHPHLIKLLATYRQDGRYYLLFPYANSNLRTYWEERPNPEFNRANMLWSLQQMTGIAYGLLYIHNFSVTYPLSVGTGNVRMPKGNVKLSVKGGEEWYGRHGDIKPENILWFDQHKGNENLMGVLQIADFGLGRFHGRDSRSNRNPDTINGSPTYEPPECTLRLPVSRKYDIWSLGCLYLEFITWLLEGFDEIDTFADARGQVNLETKINDDNFFTIINDAEGSRGIVRPAVNQWVSKLHAHKNCSPLIHDLLDLTMKEMVVVESKNRATAGQLYQQLNLYLKKAEFDHDYLLKPEHREHKPVTERSNSTPTNLDIPKATTKRLSVTFSTEEIIEEKQAPVQSKTMKPVYLPKDLVFRKLGTPGMKGINTWPAGEKSRQNRGTMVASKV